MRRVVRQPTRHGLYYLQLKEDEASLISLVEVKDRNPDAVSLMRASSWLPSGQEAVFEMIAAAAAEEG